MDLRQLEMLLAVAEAGTYKSAGVHLHVSHSAIHRKIRILEVEIGHRVLVRTGRRVRLTSVGTLMVDAARRVQRELHHVHMQIGEASGQLNGELRIGTGTTILTFFLPHVLEQFSQSFPGVHLSIMTATGERVVADIVQSKLDLGLVYDPGELPLDDKILDHEVLYRDHFVLAIGPGHPLASRKSVSLGEIAQYPLILYPHGSTLRRLFDQVFRSLKLTVKCAMELENEEAIEKMLSINIAIAFLAKRRAVSDKIRYLRIREPLLYCDVGLVLPKPDFNSAPAREFARICREAAHLTTPVPRIRPPTPT